MQANKEIKRPVLRYHGGKFVLAPWIISHYPAHRIYVEGFGGGGSPLMRKERSYAEVYNDVWDTVVNVFAVLRDPEKAALLEEALRLTPYSRTEFAATAAVNFNEVSDQIEKARLTIFRSFAGFGSAATDNRYNTGFRANSNRSGTTPAHDWKNYPDHIKTFTERLRGVTIENRDYRTVVDANDSVETLVYLDPPYVHFTRTPGHTRAYAHEMTDLDHAAMCEYILTKKSMFIVSGYANDIYTDLLPGFTQVSRKAFADGAKERTEVLYLSPNCSEDLSFI